MTPNMAVLKALVCDVFGTVVDVQSPIRRECEAFGAAHGLTVDWAQFVEAWNAARGALIRQVRRGERPWTNLDAIHRMTLQEMLVRFGITGLSEAEMDHWSRVWHRLMPWPDAIAGLTRLRQRFIVAALSNGNVALLVNMAKRAGLPWDCILSAEFVQHYKPDLDVYRTSLDLLDLKTEDVLMVATHAWDLRAAQTVGLRTAFVQRPLETHASDIMPMTGFDLYAHDFNDLASQLGV